MFEEMNDRPHVGDILLMGGDNLHLVANIGEDALIAETAHQEVKWFVNGEFIDSFYLSKLIIDISWTKDPLNQVLHEIEEVCNWPIKQIFVVISPKLAISLASGEPIAGNTIFYRQISFGPDDHKKLTKNFFFERVSKDLQTFMKHGIVHDYDLRYDDGYHVPSYYQSTNKAIKHISKLKIEKAREGKPSFRFCLRNQNSTT